MSYLKLPCQRFISDRIIIHHFTRTTIKQNAIAVESAKINDRKNIKKHYGLEQGIESAKHSQFMATIKIDVLILIANTYQIHKNRICEVAFDNRIFMELNLSK